MEKVIKIISSISKKVFGTGKVKPFTDRIADASKASAVVFEMLNREKPCMIARYGATELMTIVNYLGVRNGRPNIISYLMGRELDWWWRESTKEQMRDWSGFFPPTTEKLEKFCEMMLEDSKELDILVSWLDDESRLKHIVGSKTKIQGLFIEPFWAEKPWPRALAGKRVLVVHPFAGLIEKQYRNNRSHLFYNTDVLPEFELQAVKAVQSLGGESHGFNTWFDALEHMKNEIDHHDYDVCLLGCGAYGFPLAAHVKRCGKKAVHIGGALQLMFGIKGRRWENPEYGVKELGKTGCYTSLFNEYWVRPGDNELSINAKQVENGCYW